MNIFVLSGALLLFDRKIHMENIFIRVTYLQAQAL